MTVKNRKSRNSVGRPKKKKHGAESHRRVFSRSVLQEALAFHQAGCLQQAESLYRKILQVEPDNPEVLHYLGMLAHQAGKSGIGLELIGRAVACRPDYAEALNNLGILLHGMGKLEEAAANFRRALTAKPDFFQSCNNLGISYYEMGRLDEAIACFRQAVSLKTDYVQAYYNLGNALKSQGRLDEAASSFRRALTLKPDYVEAANNLGLVCIDQGKLDEAVACFRRAISLNALNAQAHNNLGIALKEQGRIDDAIAGFRQALALMPDFAEAYSNLGNLLRDQGALAEAIACYRRALASRPDYAEAHSCLLFCLNYSTDVSAFDYLEEARRYGRIAADRARFRFSDWTCSPEPERLRVGLVSGDFWSHPVGYFLENLLAHLGQARIDLIAYSTNHKEDELTDRIRPYFAAYQSLLGMNDEAAARLIRREGAHVLIDLAGHTGHNRLPVFAWKPAPIQVTWLGYFASTGLAAMDYLLADPVCVPQDHREHFTEEVWYLPETRLCFSPPVTKEETKALAPTPLPALRNGFITFGSFQKMSKINEQVLASWGRILQALPQARLRLQNRQLHSPESQDQLRRRLAQSGIAPERVMLEEPVSRANYLAAHAQVDVILDTFPFPGGTTTCEALWMGVPTLTLAGETMISRQGASLLSSAGMRDWIATDVADYVAKAVAHAGDLERLARLRAGLRRQASASPLFDAPRFARRFGEALWGMWRLWQKDQQGVNPAEERG